VTARRLLGALLVATLTGCAESPNEPVPTVTATPGTVEVAVRADGELVAARSTVIKIPPQLSGWQTIGWIAEPGSAVTEGDPVVVFSDAEIVLDEDDARRRVGLGDLRIEASVRDFDTDELHLHNQLEVLALERDMAETFAPSDELIFSRNEILEAAIDLEYLGTESDYLERETGKLEERRRAELELLSLQRQTHQLKLEQLEEAEGSLVVRAPHDGIFLLDDDWDEGDLQPGCRVHPFWSLGELPDLSRMQAKVWVHESEAGSLEPGMEARLTLDMAPGRDFPATVASMAGVAAAIDADNPAKYFEVLLDVEGSDSELLRPRHRVEATIFVARLEDAMAVPNQAVFQEDETTYVYVEDGGSFRRTEVEVGLRGPSRTVIAGGIEPGEVVALVRPEGG
jgi:multidrug efflux pump subunit AcrA (membrane-fusion protein)